uniref:Uncharacterized protein n=1 Tax=Salix viminalis TaxID=40686 RepID=A0A6N2M069_SALVM
MSSFSFILTFSYGQKKNPECNIRSQVKKSCKITTRTERLDFSQVFARETGTVTTLILISIADLYDLIPYMATTSVMAKNTILAFA